MAATFAAAPEVVKVQFRTEVIDAEGRPTGAIKPAAHLPMPSGDVGEAELASPYDLVWMATSADAFRTSALRRIMPIPEDEFRTCADWYLVHLTALLGPVVSLDAVAGAYRVHGQNNYEPQAAELDIEHLRELSASPGDLGPAAGAGDRLGRPRPPQILSIADLANRMISLRLQPAAHPNRTDRPGRLVADAARAARRRTNVSAPMKLIFVAWFAAMAIAPRPLARRLALWFLFPHDAVSPTGCSACCSAVGRGRRPSRPEACGSCSSPRWFRTPPASARSRSCSPPSCRACASAGTRSPWLRPSAKTRARPRRRQRCSAPSSTPTSSTAGARPRPGAAGGCGRSSP